MLKLTLADVAAAVGGRLHRVSGTEVVTGGVEFDSRKLTSGDLFVAVPGERVDGHDFAEAAIRAGAVAVLAGRAVPVPSVIVPAVEWQVSRAHALAGDTDGSGAAVLAGLAALARSVLDRLVPDGLAVVGVTGSAGKTSTKDLIGSLLARLGATVAPPNSFNNELGLPWTVLRADEHTRHLVLEMSARGVGHIAALARIAPPRIGAVLNVGTSHLGEFGSREAIAQAKGELVEALPAGGLAVLNADDPLVAAMSARTKARVAFVGRSADASVRAVDVALDDQARPGFRLVTPVGEADVVLGLHGEHHVGNALTAAAVALELGMDVAGIAAGLADARPASRRRMEVTTRRDGVTVVNDAYNASPESMAAALRAVVRMARSDEAARRTWAVLGPMGELGDDSAAGHNEVGGLAVQLGVDRLVVVGEQARALHEGAHLAGSRGRESVLVPDADAAVALLRDELRPGDVVLVKASNAVGLWRVADELLAVGGTA
ncbi:MAG TPA: UDP-N-acetylmuramoyl-tripeptide--D-alanyl-D-alanine ligase [Pseudonocardiaceae bacterium]|nr:UDP-N-acetylmuramoyl-tripeptide--D-alanyl-D-alanine ligase [Pseudonocardiaceae bacterium]